MIDVDAYLRGLRTSLIDSGADLSPVDPLADALAGVAALSPSDLERFVGVFIGCAMQLVRPIVGHMAADERAVLARFVMDHSSASSD